MPDLSAVFHQQPPFEQDVFRYGQDPPCERRPQCKRQPVIQLGASRGVFLKLNAEANFGDVHDADIELVERLAVVKGQPLSAPALASALPTEYWCPATTPSKHDVSHTGEAHAGWCEIDVAVGRSL
jgi:hypothetical protein